MSPPAATAAGRGGKTAKRSSPKKRAAVKGGLAKPPRASSRVSGRNGARTVRRSAAPRAARRVSGPSGGRAAAGVAVALPRTQVAPLGPRLVAFASTLPDRSVVERMVRGRVWIGVLAFLLIGLVAMQVSLLKLNAGIGSAVERSSALERANGALRAQVSQLESGERIQAGAAALGMVMPPAGQISYLRSGADVDGAVAALREGRFNDSAHAIPLPGADDPPDPLAAALAGGGMTEEGVTEEDAAAGETSEEAGAGAEGETSTDGE
ncbi:MAG TPA: hypothetical protein VNB64_10095 [Solirubrobacteraceae bacterium]|nr:hypothetical protein [Solirubrobacteraceae bacterium]